MTERSLREMLLVLLFNTVKKKIIIITIKIKDSSKQQ